MIKRNYITLGFIIALFVAVTLIFIPKNKSSYDQKIIKIGTNEYTVEIADTEVTKSQGLSGRISMAKNKGMLFVFNQRSNQYFWMKGMNFPLDFVWIDGNKVVDVTQNVPKPVNSDLNSLTTFTAKYPFDKVLELNAGTVVIDNIKIGDIIKL